MARETSKALHRIGIGGVERVEDCKSVRREFAHPTAVGKERLYNTSSRRRMTAAREGRPSGCLNCENCAIESLNSSLNSDKTNPKLPGITIPSILKQIISYHILQENLQDTNLLILTPNFNQQF